ncbi:hypothetical protein BJF81_10060 [Ornithinimicrobium sp. CNJ-824]|uniref:hypothetical protein n=1 Tax=Ornithinimicrobium sp. CNJ-824 TaxID=1904966 RepID=UPI00096870DE|nr:hypothetical protein [Ornithinimicrobium sp. CNJ-824]OLT23684.1 hypothetical protein BJF81_10060 [Ornithinimicrobium sp. CNJ-824]
MTVTTAPHAPAGRSVTLLAPLALAGMASQSLLLVLAPSMAAVADDLGVGVPAVGQARTVTAAVALAGASCSWSRSPPSGSAAWRWPGRCWRWPRW